MTGSGDVFLQINGLVSYSWIAVGLGHQMAGAKIFVMYADGSGNITISPRLGLGHYEPRYDSTADFEVLDGSGVEGYRMTANIRCKDCMQWVGGGMDWTKPSGMFIWAARPGLPLDSSDPEENLLKHQQHGVFQWAFEPAIMGNYTYANPFLFTTPADVTLGVHGGLPPVPLHWNPSDSFPVAHGTVASFALLVLFPAGAILIKVTSNRRLVWVHAGMQIGAYVMLLAAMGLGIHIASSGHLFSDKHPQIGIVLVVILFFQAVDGLLHHAQWMKNSQKRTVLTYVHMWTGRVMIFLGMVNGAFGLQLAGVNDIGKWAGYGVVAGISAVSLIGAIIYGERKRHLFEREKKEALEREEAEAHVSGFE
jgi:hypothetical protein